MRARALPLLLLLAMSCSSEQRTHPIPRVPASKGLVLTAQDRDFLERAAEGNDGEVSTGALVHGRASRAEVVQLAVMVPADHRAANAQLAAIARRHVIALPTSLGEHQAAFDRLADLERNPFDEQFVKVMIGEHQQAVTLRDSRRRTAAIAPSPMSVWRLQ